MYADMESVFHYKPVADAAAQMLVSGYKEKAILPEMRKLGEISRDDETLKLVAQIFSQGHQRGYITKADLNRLAADAKVPIFPALLKAMGAGDTRQSRIALFKRLRTPSKDPVDWKFMEGALNILTGPGGALHGHQMEQLMTFAGQKSSFDERIKDAEEGLVRIFNKFVYPWMRMINKISPTTILGWFSQIEPKVLRFGDELRNAFQILVDQGQFQEVGTTLSDIFSKIGSERGSVFGVKGASAADTITKAFGKINDVLHFINLHFKDNALWTKFVLVSLARRN